MSTKHFKVLRQHLGDRSYAPGEFRTANPREVAHLVASGTLKAVEKAAPKAQNKAAPTVENKNG